MDDIKIAELFIRSRNTQARLPLTIAATGDAYSLAVRYQQIDHGVKILPTNSDPTLDWSTLVSQGEEQWPIAFLMPSGAYIQ